MKFKYILFICLYTAQLNARNARNQVETASDSLNKGKLTVGTYVDMYLNDDLNQPDNSDRPYFVSSNRHAEFNVNLAFFDFKYVASKFRAHVVPGFGTYMNANYAQERGLSKYIFEANAGWSLSKDRNIWVDAGVLSSPYTNESAISKDQLSYSRSLASEFSPYFLTGVKLSLPVNKKLNTYFYLINGWQVIQDNNKSLALGTQIEYKPNDKLLLNWNTYTGDESSAYNPDFRMRYFADFYANYNPDKKMTFTFGTYYGVQEKKDSAMLQSFAKWGQANIQFRYAFTEKSSFSLRAEYFDDPSSVQIQPVTNISGFNCTSYSLCYNLKIKSLAMFRLESRYFLSQKDVFYNSNGNLSNSSLQFFSNLSIWL